MSVFRKLFLAGGKDEEEVEEIDDSALDFDEGGEDAEEEFADEGLAGDEDGQLALDVYQDKNNLVIKSTIAGVGPEDLDISLSEGMVKIRGERKQEHESEDGDYFYKECYWGSFSRELPIPVEVDIDKAEADIKDGILTIVIPKAGKSKTKKLKVKSE